MTGATANVKKRRITRWPKCISAVMKAYNLDNELGHPVKNRHSCWSICFIKTATSIKTGFIDVKIKE